MGEEGGGGDQKVHKGRKGNDYWPLTKFSVTKPHATRKGGKEKQGNEYNTIKEDAKVAFTSTWEGVGNIFDLRRSTKVRKGWDRVNLKGKLLAKQEPFTFEENPCKYLPQIKLKGEKRLERRREVRGGGEGD